MRFAGLSFILAEHVSPFRVRLFERSETAYSRYRTGSEALVKREHHCDPPQVSRVVLISPRWGHILD